MKKLNQILTIALGLGLVAVAGTIMNSRQAVAQNPNPGSAPVNIVAPLPLPVTGSATVSGTITANQGGAWNVGITGNSVSNPLFVRDVDGATQQPVVFTLSSANQSVTIPANKRLIIQYVSWRGTANQNFIVAVGLSMTTNGSEVIHYIPGSPVTGENIGGAKVWLVGDPGSQVVYQSAGSIGSGKINVAGYYVNP